MWRAQRPKPRAVPSRDVPAQSAGNKHKQGDGPINSSKGRERTDQVACAPLALHLGEGSTEDTSLAKEGCPLFYDTSFRLEVVEMTDKDW